MSTLNKLLSNTISRRSLIVGDDATRFAVRMGFEEASLGNQASVKSWEEWLAKGEASDAWQPEPRGDQTVPQV